MDSTKLLSKASNSNVTMTDIQLIVKDLQNLNTSLSNNSLNISVDKSSQTLFQLPYPISSTAILTINKQEQVNGRDYSISQRILNWISNDFPLDKTDNVILNY